MEHSRTARSRGMVFSRLLPWRRPLPPRGFLQRRNHPAHHPADATSNARTIIPSRAFGGAVLALLTCLLAITTAVPVGVHGSPQLALLGRSSFRRGSEGSVDDTRYPWPVPPRKRRFDLSHSVGMQFRADAENSDVDEPTLFQVALGRRLCCSLVSD